LVTSEILTKYPRELPIPSKISVSQNSHDNESNLIHMLFRKEIGKVEENVEARKLVE
jgi:hypothetical protein